MGIEISNPGGIIVELDPFAVPLAGGAMTGTLYVPEIRNILNENLIIDTYNDTGAGTHNLFKFNPFGGGLELPTNSSGIKFGDATTQVTAGLPLTGGGTVSGNVTISLGNVEDELQTFVVKNYNANPYFVVSPYENYSQLGNVILDGDEITIKDPANSNVAMLTLGKFSSSPNIYGIRYNDNSIQTTAFIPANYAALAGATFTGKVNVNTGTGNVPLNIGITGTPSAYTNGDVWIAGSDMRFRDSAGATKILISAANSNAFTTYQSISSSNNSNPALKITQLGTGEALRVEDETSPDATAFVVSNNGRVGIGVAPDATVALTVDSTGVKFNDSSVQVTKGDRYKATSSTSNTVDSGNGKSFTTQPNLAYTPLQTCIIYSAANPTGNHMHCTVVSYNETTGVLVVDADTNTGSGTHTDWVINK